MMSDSVAAPRVHPVAWWRGPALTILASGLLACTIWTVPTWSAFWSTLSLFPALWQVPAYHRPIIALVIKFVSPLPIMSLTGIAIWLSVLIHSCMTLAETSATKSVEHMALATAPVGVEPPASLSSSDWNAHPTLPLTTSALAPEQPEAQPGEQQTDDVCESADTPVRLAPAEVREQASPISSSLATPPEDAFDVPEIPLAAYISIRLLKEVTLAVNVPGGKPRSIALNVTAKRVQLLAFLAARRGKLVHRDTILHYLFEWGSSSEADEDEDLQEEDHLKKLSMSFETHKKLLRRDIRRVVGEINREAGREVIPAQIDPFTDRNEHWGIASLCRVDDLEELEEQYALIEAARKDGQLLGAIPPEVRRSCDRIIALYVGDFMEEVISKNPRDFHPWEGKASWARQYNTHYRDIYLKARWLAGEAEQELGQQCAEQADLIRSFPSDDAERLVQLQEQERQHYGRAIDHFRTYAIHACNTRFDEKVSYDPTTRVYGERITESERALRRCLALCGRVGNTHEIGEIYATYSRQMSQLFRGWKQTWSPSEETQQDLASAGALTDAYRFAAQIASGVQE